jgi:hypothetical protein
VNADERDEIAASVAAQAELGPRYDAALAEGLVERIGEEIDRRVDARLRGMGAGGMGAGGMGAGGMGAGHQHGGPRQGYLSPGQQIVPPGYPGVQAAGGAPAGAAPAAAAPQPAAQHRGSGVTGMILGLGSMGIGIGTTAIVVSHHASAVAEVLMVLLIWVAIFGINLAHSQRR